MYVQNVCYITIYLALLFYSTANYLQQTQCSKIKLCYKNNVKT